MCILGRQPRSEAEVWRHGFRKHAGKRHAKQKPGGEKLRPCGFEQVGVEPHSDDAQQKCGRSLSAGAGCYSVVGEGVGPARSDGEIWLAVVLKPF